MAQRPVVSDHSPKWHREKLIEFTRLKLEVGEPSPHLAIMGHLVRDMPEADGLWALGCYAATYCLPTAQVIWSLQPFSVARKSSLEPWIRDNWPGIVTRTERRCVRSPVKMAECLASLARWIENDFPALRTLPQELTHSNYDVVWESVNRIKFFGRYINIRFVEGLRRYFKVPAMLYDIRSVGGWSPKRCLCFIYPEHIEKLLVDDVEGNALTNMLCAELLSEIKAELPEVNEYVFAAMLCEYKACYENYHQYPAWTIDQEPLMYDKVYAYWGDDIDTSLLWNARAALFPQAVLGEISGWHGTRWPLTRCLHDHGYNWSDLKYDWARTDNVARPFERVQ
jgi:hypothetical protein